MLFEDDSLICRKHLGWIIISLEGRLLFCNYISPQPTKTSNTFMSLWKLKIGTMIEDIFFFLEKRFFVFNPGRCCVSKCVFWIIGLDSPNFEQQYLMSLCAVACSGFVLRDISVPSAIVSSISVLLKFSFAL